MRRLLLVAAVVLAWPVAATAQVSPAPTVPVVVIDGKGFGHGVGMAQDGAYWMGAAGRSTEQILGQFYPGTGLGRARGPVRVAVFDAGRAPSGVVLGFPTGGEVRESGTGPASAGFPLRVPSGGEVEVQWDGGRYRVLPRFAAGPTAAPTPARRGRCRGPSGRQDGHRSGCGTTGRATATSRVELAAGVRPQVPTLVPPPESTTTTSPPPPPSSTTTAPPASTTTLLGPSPSSTTTTTGPSSTTTTSAPTTPSGGDARETTRPVVAVPSGTDGSVALPVRQRRYRGVVELSAAAGTLRLVNVLDVETYLKGMGEVRDPSWPQASLRSQAIAARTYAMRAMLSGGELCDTQRCQVYLGAQAEYGAMNAAVDATREQVLTFNRALASAVYSANGGGFSASREEGFGVASDASAPYLRAAPYLTKDPAPWSVTVALTDVASRLGYAGTLTDVRTTRVGPSGRAIEVTLDGSAGPKAVTGIAFDAALGLRSTLFSLRIEAAAAPPPPPPPAEEAVVQAPPDQAAAVVAEEVAAPASSATTTIRPDPSTRWRRLGDDDHVPEELLLFAAWAVLAAIGALVVRFSGRPTPPPPLPTPTRRPPSPSAPPSADGSP